MKPSDLLTIHAATTPGPWHVHEDEESLFYTVVFEHAGSTLRVCKMTGLGVMGEKDAAFIATAHAEVPALCAEIARLRRLVGEDQ